MSDATLFLTDERTFWHCTGVQALFFPIGDWVEPPSGSYGADTPASKRRLLNLVRVAGLDKHLEEFPVGPRLQLIVKIDAEGGERQVLDGARETIRSRRPWLMMEILPRGDREFFEAFACEHSYHFHPLRTRTKQDKLDRLPDESPSWNYLLVPVESNSAASLNFN